jgi:signal transduction histidine kinase
LAIISDLLNYSRLEAGQVNYRLVPVDLIQCFTVVLGMMEAQATKKDINLEQENSIPARVMADRLKLEQILLNLLSNAVKFTASGGRVAVGSEIDDSFVNIRVTDSGPGIPPEMQHEVFEPFVQLGRTLTTTQAGTGLGLSISRDLAQAMNGELTIEHSAPEGTTFLLRLPVA